MPPSLGAVKDTVALALPLTALAPVGAPGTAKVVIELEAADSELLPTILVN